MPVSKMTVIILRVCVCNVMGRAGMATSRLFKFLPWPAMPQLSQTHLQQLHGVLCHSPLAWNTQAKRLSTSELGGSSSCMASSSMRHMRVVPKGSPEVTIQNCQLQLGNPSSLHHLALCLAAVSCTPPSCLHPASNGASASDKP